MKLCFSFLLVILSCSSAVGQSGFYSRLADSALTLTYHKVVYDARYVRIPYPGGDVAADKGVCTDVIIRAYRMLGIDLQKEVHEDMRRNFAKYPGIWGLSRPDRNIDHRRVPNLMRFFSRHGTILSGSANPDDYSPGDIVCWKLTEGTTHIGLVSNKRSEDGRRFMIVHNIGAGQVLEDCLFKFTIIGHYRYAK